MHQGGPAFHQCLRSVQAARPAPDEVLVVVDGPGGGAEAIANQFGVRTVRTGDRGGPARARNLGARQSRGDILFFIDADVAVQPTAVRQVLQAFEHDPGLSAVIGSYDDAPAEANFFSQYKNLFQHYVHQNAREEAYTFCGACGAVRRDAFLGIGGFDEGYRLPSIEDIELGYRLKAAGHRIRVCKDFQVKHLKRWGPVSLFLSDFFRRALPWTALILRTGVLQNDLNVSRACRVKVALVYCLLGALGLSWWWVGGLPVAALVAAVLLTMDAGLLQFFSRKRGVYFALRTIPCHWFYYFYSGLAFALGLGLRARALGRGLPRPAEPAAVSVGRGSAPD